jgi:hypothetical protein
MYGLVNQAIQDLVLTRYGRPTWVDIVARAEVRVDPFLAMSPYPDDMTYRLVAAAAEVLGARPEEILERFGEFWIEYSAEHGYGELLDLLGDDLLSFLRALDGMHDRLRLTFPDLRTPSIWCTDVTPESFFVHYASDRAGLTPFLVGLLRATGRRFGEDLDVRLMHRRDDGRDHDEFLVLRRPLPGDATSGTAIGTATTGTATPGRVPAARRQTVEG